jgi:exonuclease SbcD
MGSDVPIIAMGHLFTQGGVTLDADGVRELYVGSLAHIGADCFDGYDYVAWGICMCRRRVGKQEHIRYCGSPIPMGFGEAKQQKQVFHVTFTGRLPEIQTINIPCFQVLQRIQGDLPTYRPNCVSSCTQAAMLMLKWFTKATKSWPI